MNIDSILICEYATVDAGGSLTVLRTFNGMHASKFPATLPSMAVAIVIEAHESERDAEHHGEIRLLTQERRVAATWKTTFDFKASHPLPGIPLRHTWIHRLLNVTFSTAGAYAFEVYVDDTYLAGSAFHVGLVQE